MWVHTLLLYIYNFHNIRVLYNIRVCVCPLGDLKFHHPCQMDANLDANHAQVWMLGDGLEDLWRMSFCGFMEVQSYHWGLHGLDRFWDRFWFFPRKLKEWKLKMMGLESSESPFPQTLIFRFHVKLQWCKDVKQRKGKCKLVGKLVVFGWDVSQWSWPQRPSS